MTDFHMEYFRLLFGRAGPTSKIILTKFGRNPSSGARETDISLKNRLKKPVIWTKLEILSHTNTNFILYLFDAKSRFFISCTVFEITK